MVINELLSDASRYVDRLDAEVLLSHILGCSRVDLFLKKDLTITDLHKTLFDDLIQKRTFGCPVSYLTGTKEFYSLDFFVNEDVLIPRPDTETLVDYAVPLAKDKKILDLCCGSGCIGISVFVYGEASSLSLCDISEKALLIAEKNAALHKVNAEFFKIDILSQNIKGEYDIILSNPPYIETHEIALLQNDVRDFEPHGALDGGADGLIFYPQIIAKSASALASDGYLITEIGETQGNAVSSMMSELFQDVKIIKDLAGKDRAVTGRKK